MYHSDIGGHQSRGGFLNGANSFPVGLFPNESELMLTTPIRKWPGTRAAGIVYLGKENKIWKSTDGGTSYTALYTFPGNVDNTVFDIEVKSEASRRDLLLPMGWY